MTASKHILPIKIQMTILKYTIKECHTSAIVYSYATNVVHHGFLRILIISQ